MICKVFYDLSTGAIEGVEETNSTSPVSEALITEMLGHSNYGIIQVCSFDPDVDGKATSNWSTDWKVDITTKKLVAV